jgi:hypothetical protein
LLNRLSSLDSHIWDKITHIIQSNSLSHIGSHYLLIWKRVRPRKYCICLSDLMAQYLPWANNCSRFLAQYTHHCTLLDTITSFDRFDWITGCWVTTTVGKRVWISSIRLQKTCNYYYTNSCKNEKFVTGQSGLEIYNWGVWTPIFFRTNFVIISKGALNVFIKFYIQFYLLFNTLTVLTGIPPIIFVS